MTRPRAPRAAQVAVVLLALAAVGLTVRAAATKATTDRRHAIGRFGADAPKARSVLARLGRGLLACQEEDGGFRESAAIGSRHNDDAERVAVSALACAALAQMRDLGVALEGLEAALARTRAFLRVRQSERGAVLGSPPGAVRLQVEATAGAAWTWLVANEADDAPLLREAGAALRRMGKQGFENGYPRALVAMFAERVAREGREGTVLEGQSRELVGWREQKVLPTEGGFELWDASLAEAISRTVLGQWSRTQGAVDPFPGRVLRAVLAKPPEWTGKATDMQAFWMQAWIVARSRDGETWFQALLEVISEWANEETGLLDGSFYAGEVLQTAAASLAIAEGLLAEPLSP